MQAIFAQEFQGAGQHCAYDHLASTLAGFDCICDVCCLQFASAQAHLLLLSHPAAEKMAMPSQQVGGVSWWTHERCAEGALSCLKSL
jgi:hypothetical protein